MRVLFTVVGARPHLYPMVPLAWALRAAGHEVRIAGTTAILDDIVHTGLPAVAVGSAPQHTSATREELATLIYQQPPWPVHWAADVGRLDPPKWSYLQVLGRQMIASAEAMADDLVRYCQYWRPRLIVHDAVSYAGAVAAEAIGVPNVRHLFGSASVPRLEVRQPGQDPLDEYVALFDRRGLAVRIDPTTHVEPTPPGMRLVEFTPRLDMRYVPYNGPGRVPEWLADDRVRPRVCVTWGHTSARALGSGAADPYRDAIDAIAATGIDVVIATTQQQVALLGALPVRVRAVADVPLHLLMPYCDALVQQGGDGTTLSAAAHAVPQVIISRKPDAELAAGRLAALGAGIHLRYQELRGDPDRRDIVRHAVHAVLADLTYRDAARRLRDEIEKQPTPAELVPAIETLVGT